MAERLPSGFQDTPVGDRLQPSLLDRLTDDAPDKRTESIDQVAMTRARLRRAVLRDLAWLFNTTNLEADLSLANHPHARTSTINYGVPALSGTMLTEINFSQFDQALTDAIVAFEPRLFADTVQVHSTTTEEHLSHHNMLGFEVRAKLWAMPYPLELLLRSNLDVESGLVVVQEQATPGG
ncbi:MAG: type VI secretion system baseplate subunit TssE [Casimicrobiaceae bacterium]